MGAGLTSLLLSAGVSCWVYSKLMSQTGGNTGTAIKASIGVGIAVFFLCFSLMSFLPKI